MRIIVAVAFMALTFAVHGQTARGQLKKPDPKIVPPVSEYLGKPVKFWIQQMNDTDPAKAVSAVEAIMNFSPENATQALDNMIKIHSTFPAPAFSAKVLDPSMRLALTSAIGVILAKGDKSMTPKEFASGIARLQISLKDPQVPIRIRALESLGALGFSATAATQDVLNLAKDLKESWEVRRAAFMVLRPLAYDPKAGVKQDLFASIYLALNQEPCYQVRMAAIEALMYSLNLIDAKAKADFVSRMNILGGISGTGSDPDPMVVMKANWAVMKASEAVVKVNADKIVSLMKNADPEVRIQAIQTGTILGIQMKNSSFVPGMILCLEDKDLRVKLGAIQGLGASAKLAPAAVPFLKQLLDDKEMSVKTAALSALGSMGYVAFPAATAIIDKMGNPDLELLAINALGNIGESPPGVADDPRVEPLIKKLDDTNLNIRGAAMISLGKIMDPRAVPYLLKRLNDPNPNVQMMAITALGVMGPKAGAEAVKALIDRLNHLDLSVRLSVIQTLGYLRSKNAAMPLAQLLTDSNKNVQGMTLQALATMGPEAAAAAPAICKLLDSRDNEIVGLSIRALGLIGPSAKDVSAPALQKVVDDTNRPSYLREGARQAIDVYILEKFKKKTDSK